MSQSIIAGIGIALHLAVQAAADHVHLLFYIWLTDNNGCRIVDALIRAAGRGVTCRAMADDLGSRLMIHSEHWQRMQAAGVRLVRALPVGNPLPPAQSGVQIFEYVDHWSWRRQLWNNTVAVLGPLL